MRGQSCAGGREALRGRRAKPPRLLLLLLLRLYYLACLVSVLALARSTTMARAAAAAAAATLCGSGATSVSQNPEKKSPARRGGYPACVGGHDRRMGRNGRGPGSYAVSRRASSDGRVKPRRKGGGGRRRHQRAAGPGGGGGRLAVKHSPHAARLIIARLVRRLGLGGSLLGALSSCRPVRLHVCT